MFFGELDPRSMPSHLFFGAIRLDFDSALKADISKQNYSVCPRYWYIDATFNCRRCENEFCFTAEEQRNWYEQLNFYVDSLPKHCLPCRRRLRDQKQNRQEYDRDIAAALHGDDAVLKQRLAALIDELCESGVRFPTESTSIVGH